MLSEKLQELKNHADKLAAKAERFSRKIERTLSNKELEELEKLEFYAENAFEEYLKEYYILIGGEYKKCSYDGEFQREYCPDDEIGYSEPIHI